MERFPRLNGIVLNNTITLSASATTESVNVFRIEGSVDILKLCARITDASTLTNLTAASFDLYDGTATVQITAATGVLSGMAVDTYFVKAGLAANAFDVNNNATCSLVEQTYEGSGIFSPFIITQKTGTNTYLRFTYTTTDAPIDAKINIAAEYDKCQKGKLFKA